MNQSAYKLRKALSVCVALIFCAFLIVGTLALSGCEEEENQVESIYRVNGDTDDTEGGQTGGNVAEEDPSDGEAVVEGLEIPLQNITTTAKFYGVYVDDTYMEIIAVRYGGAYRTAFNTCQVCYGSPSAYFVQSGNYLICQNCRSKFLISQVGVSSAGCSPYPIYESDRVQTADAIIIPNDFLVRCKAIFKNWKVGV